MIWLFSLIITIFGIIGVIKSIKNENDDLFIISIFVTSAFFLVFILPFFPN